MSDSLVKVDSVNKTYQRGGEKLVVLDNFYLYSLYQSLMFPRYYNQCKFFLIPKGL